MTEEEKKQVDYREICEAWNEACKYESPHTAAIAMINALKTAVKELYDEALAFQAYLDSDAAYELHFFEGNRAILEKYNGLINGLIK